MSNSCIAFFWCQCLSLDFFNAIVHTTLPLTSSFLISVAVQFFCFLTFLFLCVVWRGVCVCVCVEVYVYVYVNVYDYVYVSVFFVFVNVYVFVYLYLYLFWYFVHVYVYVPCVCVFVCVECVWCVLCVCVCVCVWKDGERTVRRAKSETLVQASIDTILPKIITVLTRYRPIVLELI